MSIHRLWFLQSYTTPRKGMCLLARHDAFLHLVLDANTLTASANICYRAWENDPYRAPHDWEITCGSDWVFYKLQNDTKYTVIAHSYRKLRETNCLLVQRAFSEKRKSMKFSMVSVHFRLQSAIVATKLASEWRANEYRVAIVESTRRCGVYRNKTMQLRRC